MGGRSKSKDSPRLPSTQLGGLGPGPTSTIFAIPNFCHWYLACSTLEKLHTLGQLSQIGSEVERAESGFDLATRVIQMFGEDIDSGVWCDLPSGGNSR